MGEQFNNKIVIHVYILVGTWYLPTIKKCVTCSKFNLTLIEKSVVYKQKNCPNLKINYCFFYNRSTDNIDTTVHKLWHLSSVHYRCKWYAKFFLRCCVFWICLAYLQNNKINCLLTFPSFCWFKYLNFVKD